MNSMNPPYSDLKADENPQKTPKTAVSIGLVHWPVYDKAGTTVVTNVTNLDIHDIARASTTYDLANYYVINRVQEQQAFVQRVIDHWQTGYGKSYNHKRHTALGPLKVVSTIEDARANLPKDTKVVVTSARDYDLPTCTSFSTLREQIWSGEAGENLLVLFGTGWGLHEEVMQQADYILDPIRGMPPNDYRHLSVRSAVSICLDRLLGKW